MQGRALFAAVWAGWAVMALMAGAGAAVELAAPGAGPLLARGAEVMSWIAVAAAGGAGAWQARRHRLLHAGAGGVVFALGVILAGPLLGRPLHASAARLAVALAAGVLGGVVSLLVGV